MAPQPPRLWPAGFDRGAIRDAAGLLLLFPIDHRPHVVLTLRTSTLERHGGQISLPGGAVDPGETYEQTALREAREEIGLDPEGVRVLGGLTPLDVHISRFRLHPIVAAADRRPSLSPADSEVARMLEIPIARLADSTSVTFKTLTRDGADVRVPAFLVDEAEIWGATAMVLAELLAVISGFEDLRI